MASEGRKHGIAEAQRGGVGFGKRGDERGGDGGALKGVAGSGEAGEESVVVVEAKADDAGVELGEAASRAAAAEEGGDRRGWPAGGGCHAATAASGEGDQAGRGICIWLTFRPFQVGVRWELGLGLLGAWQFFLFFEFTREFTFPLKKAHIILEGQFYVN